MVNSTRTEPENDARFSPQVKFYGGKAAVCFQSSLLKDNTPTINIEIAGIEAGNVKWKDKLNFQLTENELPLICGLLLGFLPDLEIKRGAKGIQMRRQKKDAKNHPGLYIYASSGSEHQHRLLLPTGVMAKACILSTSALIKELGTDMSVASVAIRSAFALHI